MISNKAKKAREMFLAIAVIEHHTSSLQNFSTYDICEILDDVGVSIEKQAKSKHITLDISFVMSINNELTKAFNLERGEFLKKDEWSLLIDDCGNKIDDDPSHILSWIFSSLYWDHLTQLKLITAWFYTNALRIQHDLPVCRLSSNNIGEFLESLSGSGPPIYDGQTFFPDTYS